MSAAGRRIRRGEVYERGRPMTDEATGTTDQTYCGKCQQPYDARWDCCPTCGAIELKASKHLTEIRNLIMFVLVLQLLVLFLGFAGIRL